MKNYILFSIILIVLPALAMKKSETTENNKRNAQGQLVHLVCHESLNSLACDEILSDSDVKEAKPRKKSVSWGANTKIFFERSETELSIKDDKTWLERTNALQSHDCNKLKEIDDDPRSIFNVKLLLAKLEEQERQERRARALAALAESRKKRIANR